MPFYLFAFLYLPVFLSANFMSCWCSNQGFFGMLLEVNLNLNAKLCSCSIRVVCFRNIFIQWKKVLVLFYINTDKKIIIPVHQNYKSKFLFADASRRNKKKLMSLLPFTVRHQKLRHILSPPLSKHTPDLCSTSPDSCLHMLFSPIFNFIIFLLAF